MCLFCQMAADKFVFWCHAEEGVACSDATSAEMPNQPGMPCWQSGPVSAPAGEASTERQKRRRLVARRGLRWGALGAPSASVGPPSACRLPPSVLSCSPAQSQSPQVHECTAPGIPPHLHRKCLVLHINVAVTAPNIVKVKGLSCRPRSQAMQACSSAQGEAVPWVLDMLE